MILGIVITLCITTIILTAGLIFHKMWKETIDLVKDKEAVDNLIRFNEEVM